jgi:antitoxin component of RelBE/YafQ-DinJ toxin-antitoxin module
MATVTVTIDSKSKRGKHLIALLSDMAKHGNDIHVENLPNNETIKAINDARAKKGIKAENIDDLFKQLEA